MAIQPFEPDPHTVYTIEAAAHFAQISRRMILIYCKHGLISPAAEPKEYGYCFNGDAVRTLRTHRRFAKRQRHQRRRYQNYSQPLKQGGRITFDRYGRRLTESVNLESRARRGVASDRGGSPEPPVGN